MQTRPKTLLWFGALVLLMLGLSAGLMWAAALIKPSTPPVKTTADLKPQTVVIAGDISCPPGSPVTDFYCRSADTANLITSLNPDAVLTAGDNQYQSGALAAFQQGYDKTWGAFKEITYPAPGNHDYGTPDAAGYYEYFGSRAGEKGKGYYSYKIGDWLMVALNSEIDISSDSAQLKWLEQVLDMDKGACTLAYWHKPRFSSGWHPSDPAYDAAWRMLYKYNADIVVNGHSHGYERFLPQNPDAAFDPAKGITEFVSGMGGAGPEELGSPLPNLATRQNHAFGVLKLSLYPNSLRYEFVPVPGQQTFSDRGTVTCH